MIRPFHQLWCVALTAGLAALPWAAGAAPAIHIEKVVGPETPTGRYKHPSSLTELGNGDLYLAYYGGEGEYALATTVFGLRLAKGAAQWSAPEPIARNPFYSMGNPVIWQASDGRVWLFFVVRPGATWSTSRIMAKISDDQARTWSEPFVITWEAGTMVRGRPIELTGGDYLLPVYHETGTDIEFVPPDTMSFFLRFDPKSKRWSESTRIRSRLGNLQPAVVELSPSELLAFCRRGGDYESGQDGFVVRSESHDGGQTWTAGVETAFPNPNAAVELIRLRNAHLVFVFNDSMSERTPLLAAVSTDGGRSFPQRRALASGPGSFAYPTAIQTADGKIHVTFTSDERTVIRRAVFEEDALSNASPDAPR
ncbi:MAG: sialidase family protein [Verrucomicrobiota bacterium]